MRNTVMSIEYSESTAVNCTSLELAHNQCLVWASTHDMRLAPQKYTLTHFTRRSNFDLEAPVWVEGREIAPSPIVRILGLQLETKLCWKAHIEAINQKMETQMYALSRASASTWGATMEKARQIYLAIIRPAVSYGAALWHRPGKKRQKGPVAKLQKHQNSGLRQVL
jgi:hypothetical protein